MTFDPVARAYRWMEYAAFGKGLEGARNAFVAEAKTAKKILLAGDGDGRFLLELLRQNPQAEVTSVEASRRMLQLARARLEREGIKTDSIYFCNRNVLEMAFPPNTFDLVATHFFLDCFEEGELRQLIPRLAQSAAPGARWLVADFRIPANGVMHWPARLLVGFLYFFFRATTGLQTRTLVAPGPLLAAAGLRQRQHRLFLGGMLSSSCWEKPGAESTAPTRLIT